MERIWYQEPPSLDQVNQIGDGTLLSHMGIQLTEMTENPLSGIMPVRKTTLQPAGLMHGGASCVLAETLGSIASFLVVDREKYQPVGQSLFTNHLKPGLLGDVIHGKASPLHIGKKSHIWEIPLFNQEGSKVSLNRLTVAIIEKRD